MAWQLPSRWRRPSISIKQVGAAWAGALNAPAKRKSMRLARVMVPLSSNHAHALPAFLIRARTERSWSVPRSIRSLKLLTAQHHEIAIELEKALVLTRPCDLLACRLL